MEYIINHNRLKKKFQIKKMKLIFQEIPFQNLYQQLKITLLHGIRLKAFQAYLKKTP